MGLVAVVEGPLLEYPFLGLKVWTFPKRKSGEKGSTLLMGQTSENTFGKTLKRERRLILDSYGWKPEFEDYRYVEGIKQLLKERHIFLNGKFIKRVNWTIFLNEE